VERGSTSGEIAVAGRRDAGKERRMIVRRYEVDICDACINLEPSECHTPGCIFFLCGMKEVGEFLNRALIRPIVDGKRIENNQPDAEVISQ
jgi:hypothetical protein